MTSTGFIPQRARWPWIVTLVGLIVIVIAVIGTHRQGPAALPAPAPAPSVALVADGWRATDIQVQDVKTFTLVTAHVTNLEASTRGAIFTITLVRNGQVVTAAHGSVDPVPSGGTVTAQLGTPKTGVDLHGLSYQLQVGG